MMRLRLRTGWTGLVVALLLAGLVVAQEGEKKGRRGRGGFGRGRGMMRMGGLPDAAALLLIPKVREELDLVDEQIADLKKLGESMRPQGRRERPNFREMSEEQRREYFEKMRKEREKRQAELNAKIKEILMPEQWERLQQIRIQAGGFRAFLSQELQQKLKITEEQLEKIRTTAQQHFQEMREQLRSAFQSGDREKLREAIAKGQKEVMEKVLGILSDSQREAYKKLTGEPFEVPQQRRFFFGRGRFGGRGDRGGPPRGRREGRDRPRPAPESAP